MTNQHMIHSLQILFSNALLLSVVLWFGQSLDSVLAYIMFTVAVISFTAFITMIRNVYKAMRITYKDEGLHSLIYKSNEGRVIIFLALLLNSILLSVWAHGFLLTDFEQSSFASNQYIFYTILATVVVTTITNHSVLTAGKAIGTFLYNRDGLLLQLAGVIMPGITVFGLFYFLRLFDTSPLYAAVALIIIKVTAEIIFELKLKTPV